MISTREITLNNLNSNIDCICDYSRGYICDIIAEIADSHTSIYYSDIINFISENVEQVNDTIEEFGWEGAGGDLYKAGQLAEYCQLEQEMYGELEEGLFNFAISYIEHELEIYEITEEQLETINDLCAGTDNNDTLDRFIDELTEIVQTEEEEEEETEEE